MKKKIHLWVDHNYGGTIFTQAACRCKSISIKTITKDFRKVTCKNCMGTRYMAEAFFKSKEGRRMLENAVHKTIVQAWKDALAEGFESMLDRMPKVGAQSADK